MWLLWIVFILLVSIAFAINYQDWIIPSRRKIGYEEMRRSIHLLKETEFKEDDDEH